METVAVPGISLHFLLHQLFCELALLLQLHLLQNLVLTVANQMPLGDFKTGH